MRRTREEILIDILDDINNNQKGIIQTKIMYKSNLSFHDMKKYLSYLIKKGYISFIKSKKPNKNNGTYIITKEGFNALSISKEALRNLNDSFI